jgi:2-polyprenyl-6-methoxyphenol hydroxylase-like FAD-dependent oxidoreductase
MIIRAPLTIAADGRHSVLRALSGLPLQEFGAQFDALWLRLPYEPGDPAGLVGRIGAGQFFVMIYRGDYWQCALGIPKGEFDRIKAQGLEALRKRLREIAGFAANRIDSIASFEQIKLLTVAVNRLQQWARPGFLCIGDAAHAMSPVGGVGINLAIQDAVAAANILVPALQRGTPEISDLHMIQRRREWPTKVIQHFQVWAQENFLAPTLLHTTQPAPPWFVRLLNAVPPLRRLPAQFIGVGVRPEHIASP